MQSREQTRAQKIAAARIEHARKRKLVEELSPEAIDATAGENEGRKHAFHGFEKETCFIDKSEKYISAYNDAYDKKLHSMPQGERDFNTGRRLGLLDLMSEQPPRTFPDKSGDFVAGYTAGRSKVLDTVNKEDPEYKLGNKRGRILANLGRDPFPYSLKQKTPLYISGHNSGYKEVRDLMTESDFYYRKGYYLGKISGLGQWKVDLTKWKYAQIKDIPSFRKGLDDGYKSVEPNLSRMIDALDPAELNSDEETIDHPITPAIPEADVHAVNSSEAENKNEREKDKISTHTFLKPTAPYRAKQPIPEKEPEEQSNSPAPKRRG